MGQKLSTSVVSVQSVRQTRKEHLNELKRRADELKQRTDDLDRHQPEQCKELREQVTEMQAMLKTLRGKLVFNDYMAKCEEFMSVIEERESADREERQEIFNELMQCLEKVESVVADVPCKPKREDVLLYNSIEEILVEAQGELNEIQTFNYEQLESEKVNSQLFIEECLKVLDEYVFKRNYDPQSLLYHPHEDNVYAKILERKLKSAGFKRGAKEEQMLSSISQDAIRIKTSGIEIVGSNNNDESLLVDYEDYEDEMTSPTPPPHTPHVSVSEGTAELHERRKDNDVLFGFKNKQKLKLPLL